MYENQYSRYFNKLKLMIFSEIGKFNQQFQQKVSFNRSEPVFNLLYTFSRANLVKKWPYLYESQYFRHLNELYLMFFCENSWNTKNEGTIFSNLVLIIYQAATNRFYIPTLCFLPTFYRSDSYSTYINPWTYILYNRFILMTAI